MVADLGTHVADEGQWLPLAAAATHLGLSVKTARRRLKMGALQARQVPGPHGPAYEVWVPTVARDNGPATQRVDSETTVELVRLVGKLQEENRVLAGRIGWLEAQLDHARALPAPQEQQMPTDANLGGHSRSAAQTANAAPQPPEATRRPWWQWWRA